MNCEYIDLYEESNDTQGKLIGPVRWISISTYNWQASVILYTVEILKFQLFIKLTTKTKDVHLLSPCMQFFATNDWGNGLYVVGNICPSFSLCRSCMELDSSVKSLEIRPGGSRHSFRVMQILGETESTIWGPCTVIFLCKDYCSDLTVRPHSRSNPYSEVKIRLSPGNEPAI